ncbi:MAG: ABC-type xylose transport system substrate-binding protein, partial [Flavobacteriales bacterium]
AMYLEPVLITKSNVDSTVVAEGFHGRGEIYQ